MHPRDRYRYANELRRAEAMGHPATPEPGLEPDPYWDELHRPQLRVGRTSIGPWAGRDDRWSERRYADEPPRRHAGKGPRGYTRSDERILEDVNEALTRDPDVDATDIEVRVEGGEVWLTGAVDGTHEKRLAAACAERVAGVTYVHDRLRVRSSAVWRKVPGTFRAS